MAILAEMDWATFVNGKRRKTSADDAEGAAVAAYDRHRYFEAVALKVESIEANGVGAMQFAYLGRGLTGSRGNKLWVDQVAPGLWEEVERAGSEPFVLSRFLTARARRLGRI